MNSSPNLSSLPAEIHIKLAWYLCGKDLNHLTQTSSRLRARFQFLKWEHCLVTPKKTALQTGRTRMVAISQNVILNPERYSSWFPAETVQYIYLSKNLDKLYSRDLSFPVELYPCIKRISSEDISTAKPLCSDFLYGGGDSFLNWKLYADQVSDYDGNYWRPYFRKMGPLWFNIDTGNMVNFDVVTTADFSFTSSECLSLIFKRFTGLQSLSIVATYLEDSYDFALPIPLEVAENLAHKRIPPAALKNFHVTFESSTLFNEVADQNTAYVFPHITSISFQLSHHNHEDSGTLLRICSCVSFPDMKAFSIDRVPRLDLLTSVMDATRNIQFLELDLTTFINTTYTTSACLLEESVLHHEVSKREQGQQQDVEIYLETTFRNSMPWLQSIRKMRVLKRLHVTAFCHENRDSRFLIPALLVAFQKYIDANGLAGVEDIDLHDDAKLAPLLEEAQKQARKLLRFCKEGGIEQILQSRETVAAIVKTLLSLIQLPDADSLPSPYQLAQLFAPIFKEDLATENFGSQRKYCGPCVSCKTKPAMRLAHVALYEMVLRVVEAHESLEYLEITLQSLHLPTVSGLSRLCSKKRGGTSKLKQILVNHQPGPLAADFAKFCDIYYNINDPSAERFVPVDPRNKSLETSMHRQKTVLPRTYYRGPNVYFLGYLKPQFQRHPGCVQAVIDVEHQRQFHNFEPSMIAAVRDDCIDNLSDEMGFKESDHFDGWL